MTDRQLRQLEREAASGDVEAKAKLLLGRVRIGDLTEERLRLAAHLGDEASWDALAGNVSGAEDLEEWVWALHEFGAIPLVRGLLAAARQARPPWYLKENPRIAAVESWAVCPCENHADQAYTQARSSAPSFRARGFGMSGGVTRFLALAPAAMEEGETGREYRRHLATSLLGSVLRAASGVPTDENWHRQLKGRTTPECIRGAIRDELVPWVLGERDPVKERVEARERLG